MRGYYEDSIVPNVSLDQAQGYIPDSRLLYFGQAGLTPAWCDQQRVAVGVLPARVYDLHLCGVDLVMSRCLYPDVRPW